MKYKVGVCQFKPQLLDIDINLKKMEKLLFDVKADLIVLPELATSGYVFSNRNEVKKVAESVEYGASIQFFQDLAKSNNTSYVYGFVEKEDNKLYNSSILINPDGTKHVYRKVHLFYEEKLWFEPGNLGFNVFPAKNNIQVGLMICFDWIFPESARTLALKGANILTHSANLVLPWCQQAMITRSLENRVFSITSNRIGEEKNGERSLYFTGQSQILNTKGEILHRMNETEETTFITEIETDDSLNKNINQYNQIFLDRKTEFYAK